MKTSTLIVYRFERNKISVQASIKNTNNSLFTIFNQAKFLTNLSKEDKKIAIQDFVNQTYVKMRETLKNKIEDDKLKIFLLLEEIDENFVDVRQFSEEIKFSDLKQISHDDIKKLNSENNFTAKVEEDNQVILIKPIKYSIVDENQKTISFLTPPINKKTNSLSAVFSIISMKKDKLNEFTQYFDNSKFKIIRIFTNLIINPFSFDDFEHVFNKEMFNIDIRNTKTHISYLVNKTIVKIYTINNCGYLNLVEAISEKSGLDKKVIDYFIKADLSKLISNHSNNSNNDFYNSIPANSKISSHELVDIFNQFISFIIKEVKHKYAKLIDNNFPILVSGKLVKIENLAIAFEKNGLNLPIRTLKPLDFTQLEDNGCSVYALFQFIKNHNDINEKLQYDTIIETTPLVIQTSDSQNSFKAKKPTFFSKILNYIQGVKNEHYKQ